MNSELAIGRLVGEGNVHRARAEDAVDGAAARWVVEAGTGAEISGVLKMCDEMGLKAVARGGGTKMDWGNPPRGVDVILSTRRMDRVLEHAAGDMTATVQAGCTVGNLQRVLAERGQWLGLDPLWAEKATIGGIIATHDSGALRAAYGTLRDHVIGMTVVLADGTVARSGGKVVKNVAGYDLPKLFTGSFGTLGVISEATLRLYSKPGAMRTVNLHAADTKGLGRFLGRLAELALVTMAVQFEVKEAGEIFVAVRVGGIAEAMAEKLARVQGAAAACELENVDAADDVWGARERLFEGEDICVGQVSLLPTKWAGFLDRLRESGKRFRLVGQAVGVGTIRVIDTDLEKVAEAVRVSGGTLTVLRCGAGVKSRIEVWPDVGNTLALMRRIKQQFDGRGTLSPGRFVGGI